MIEPDGSLGPTRAEAHRLERRHQMRRCDTFGDVVQLAVTGGERALVVARRRVEDRSARCNIGTEPGRGAVLGVDAGDRAWGDRAWGAGGALEKTPPEMGFQAIRVKVLVEGDAPREVLDEIVRHANYYSPVANSMRNPIPFEISLAD